MTTITRRMFGNATAAGGGITRRGYPLGTPGPTPGSDVPGAMRDVVVSALGDGNATLSWDAPADASMVTGFRVGRDDGAGGPGWETIDTPEKRSRVFYQLTNGTTYTLYVEAVNDDVTGPRTSVSATPPVPSGDTWAANRSKYTHPFPADSIWNRPMGTGRTLATAGLGNANAWNPHGWAKGMVTQDEDRLGLNPADPSKTLTVTAGNTALSGTAVRVPATMSHNGGWNGCAAFLDANNSDLIVQGQPLTLSAGGNPSWTYSWPPTTKVNLKTGADASRAGSHGGSHLSTLGGTIRTGELVGATPIRHALKINVYAAKYLYGSGPAGHVWPAYNADSYWNTSGHANRYGHLGSPPSYMLMGALLTLELAFDASAMHSKVQKIVTALKHYGGYIVDDTAWDVHAFNMQREVYVSGEWPTSNTTDTRDFHLDLQTVFNNLKVVTNNAAGQTVSGGGSAVASGLFAPATFTD